MSTTTLQYSPDVFTTTASSQQSAGTPKRFVKRIIVCCDGTWQDGLVIMNRWRYTNILRISRCIRNEDTRHDPPIPQITFYQSGIGSEGNFYSWLQGTTGATLAEKVQEAYAFIAQNYAPGDEIFLFGFSRGAYTARMVSKFISAIGILNTADMDHFATIFVNFQKRGKTQTKEEGDAVEKMLAPWMAEDSAGKLRAKSGPDGYSVKCIGVFDTVGALGLPEELQLSHRPKPMSPIFGFPDRLLSPDVANAFQALAINETRADFKCCKFEQTEEGRKKGQILKQCWFAGSHADIGGGWPDHDLADLTLAWMAGNIGDMLALDLEYLASLPQPVAPWGHQMPHDAQTGIYILAHEIMRKLPTVFDDITKETIHASVMARSDITPMPKEDVDEHPQLVHELLPLEKELKEKWPFNPDVPRVAAYKAQATSTEHNEHEKYAIVLEKVTKVGKEVGHKVLEKATHTETMRTQGGNPIYDKNWLAKLVDESHLGPYLKALE